MSVSVDRKGIERVNFSNRINKQLLKELKHIAVSEEKDLYIILEEALHKFVDEKAPKRR